MITDFPDDTREISKRVHRQAVVGSKGRLASLENLARKPLGFGQLSLLMQNDLTALQRIDRLAICGAQEFLPAFPGLPDEWFGFLEFSGSNDEKSSQFIFCGQGVQ